MKKIQILILCIATIISSNALAAKMGKMSVEQYIDAETPFWKVDVTCSDGVSKGAMVRGTEAEPWCFADNTGHCDTNKFSMARKICNDTIRNKLTESDSRGGSNKSVIVKKTKPEPIQNASSEVVSTINEKANDNSAIIKPQSQIKDEQFKIEEEKLQIEQKKLELRRKELELQKRQLDETLSN